jgi:23S rRNA (cytosine1962-C5)-methyltransferase
MAKAPHPSADRSFATLLSRALEGRRGLIGSGRTEAFRVLSADADGVPGVLVDVYGPGAVLIEYEGTSPRGFNAREAGGMVLEMLKGMGVRAVYYKPFAKDRSRLGGALPPETTDPTPIAGEALDEFILIREHDWRLEVRLYDGLSTGLFLDQRENRKFVRDWVKVRAAKGQRPAVLNTFAYTCAFSIAAATGGAETTSVDVSPRYLDWGKRNFSLNGIDPVTHRFAKMDTFEFFAYARRKGLRYDLIILDPPSFASGNKKKKIRPWSATQDYPRLVKEAAELLKPRGIILASTNTQELCIPGRLDGLISKAIGRKVKWITLPGIPEDFARETGRFAARAFAAG